MRKKSIKLALLVITIMALMSMNALATEQLVMSVSSVSDAAVGGTATLTVSLTSNPNLSSLDMTVEYDASALELQSMAFDSSFSNGGMSAVNPDNKKMTIVFSADTNYTGAIATLTFNVLKATSSQVWVNIIECLDENEASVSVSSTRVMGTIGVPGATACEHEFTVENQNAVGALKTPGNCQTAAVYYKSCSKCGAASTSDSDTFTGTTNPSVHAASCTLGDWVTDTANTKHWKEYSLCHAHESEAAHRSTGDHAANCQHAATCDDCGNTYGTATDHSYTAETVKPEALKSAATCTEAAVYYKSCSGCSAVSTSESDVFTYGAALGHGNWEDDYKVITAATCGEDGVAEGTCGRCQQKITNIALPATGKHTWDEGKVTKEATATAEGEKTYTCSVCGDTKTEAIAKLAPASNATDNTGSADSKGSGGKVIAKAKAPKTGDESHLAVWALVLLAACGGTAAVIGRRKKQN